MTDIKSELLALLDKVAKESIDKSGAFCTNFVLIAEFMDPNNEYWSMVYKDEDVPPWRHFGLVQYSLDNDLENIEDGEEDDD